MGSAGVEQPPFYGVSDMYAPLARMGRIKVVPGRLHSVSEGVLYLTPLAPPSEDTVTTDSEAEEEAKPPPELESLEGVDAVVLCTGE
eukprot:631725-Prorocentrum_minimum.AAC.1